MMGKIDRNNNDQSSSVRYFTQFVEIFKPEEGLQKASPELIRRFKDVMPSELLDFWQKYGFGNYGNGIIKVINPLDYMKNLYEWLGNSDILKIPIMITSFGDIFYYRKLDRDVEDICLLNIHYRHCVVCSYSLKEFFKSYIVNEDIYKEILKKELFEEAYKLKGPLKESEIYLFKPALALGGHESIEYIDKGNASIHLSILFQILI